MDVNDIHLLLGEMRSDIKTILKRQDEMREWQESHDKKDSERFTKLHDRIDGMNKYAASIAVVAGAIGASYKYIIDYIKGFS